MLIAQDKNNMRRNFELGDGVENGDGGDDVIEIGELEEQVSAKEHIAVDRTKVEACCEKSLKSPSRSTSYTLNKFDLTTFQILEAPVTSTTP